MAAEPSRQAQSEETVEHVLDDIGAIDRAADQAAREAVDDAKDAVEPLVETVADVVEEELPEGDFESVAEVLGEVFADSAVVATGSIETAAVLESGEESGAEAGEVAAGEPPPVEVDEAPGGDDAPAPAAATSTCEPKPAALARGGRVALTVVRGALVGVNYPLRYVPRRARRAVDWVALTLAVWVPIVWGLVMVLG